MSRPLNVLISVISVLITVFILDQQYSSKNTILSCIIVGLFTMFSNVINDIFDFKTDKINRPEKPLPNREINIKTVLNLLFLLFLINFTFVLNLNNLAQSIVYFIVLPIIITYTPIFKSIPLVGNFLIGGILGCVFLFSEAALTNQVKIMWIPALLATHLTVLRELLKDIEDHQGDCETNIITFPVCFGIQNSIYLFLFLTISLLLWAGLLPFYMPLNSIYLPTFWFIFSPWIFFVLYLLYWEKSANYKKISNYLKIASIFGLIVIITFRF